LIEREWQPDTNDEGPMINLKKSFDVETSLYSFGFDIFDILVAVEWSCA
jgi:hypothetical protein